jgi:hypothetical protein
MTSRNVVVYGTCGVVLVACLAAANMRSQDAEPAPHSDAGPARVAPDAIAADVRSEAARLHARMADAPTPSANPRNPFAFGAAPRTPHPASREGMVTAAVAPDSTPALGAVPPLLLMGIADDGSPSRPRRTAIIGGDADTIYMVVEGDSVGRYKVTKIGADAVELEDQTTKTSRRIAMR